MSSRRDFLKNTSGVIAACATGAMASYLESCTSIKYVSAVEKDGKLTVSKPEFGDQLFVIVKSRATPFPVYLAKTACKNQGGGPEIYSALLMRCTHKQCEVKPEGNILRCPCHGSEFSASGKVLKEPAFADLQQFAVTHDDHIIYINLK
ncbi:MAG TPA: ubiquinol-cytochrome c reductase iron-sulfur subunit [Bacteroidia bacterium]|nr:ubiquinol-cytochrome c reductase iron-sulfur subunit [Bacteroidia bacterium]